jgi:phosphoglycolate phosphatase-like HAD superfamily hydrolase
MPWYDLFMNRSVTSKKKDAIAFDFDGTLIRGGKLNNDKSIHIMYSTWTACKEYGFDRFLHPENLAIDTSRMLRAYIRYPGSPRFQQLSALVNALINQKYESISAFEELGVPENLRSSYESIKTCYNDRYSALNDAAAKKYWLPWPSTKNILTLLSHTFDLYIASGVTQDILIQDFTRHTFSQDLFKGIYGGDPSGKNDKAEILSRILAQGYQRVLFVADSNKDREYAMQAGAFFFRIKEDADFIHLSAIVKKEQWPTGKPWTFTSQELHFMEQTTLHLLTQYCAGATLTALEISNYINQ